MVWGGGKETLCGPYPGHTIKTSLELDEQLPGLFWRHWPPVRSQRNGLVQQVLQLLGHFWQEELGVLLCPLVLVLEALPDIWDVQREQSDDVLVFLVTGPGHLEEIQDGLVLAATGVTSSLEMAVAPNWVWLVRRKTGRLLEDPANLVAEAWAG